jgi:uncharacterized RDD family membrane protein YckC
LGFETGDRCKHCGYDFSLLAASSFDLPIGPDLSLRPDEAFDDSTERWLKAFDQVDTDATIDRRLDPIEEPGALDTRLNHAGFDTAEEAAPRAAETAVLDVGRPGVERPLSGSGTESVRTVGPVNDVAPAAPRAWGSEPALPLFVPRTDEDAPLITVPPAPRPPLAVRRTPPTPRLRAVARLRTSEPALDLHDADKSREADPAGGPLSGAGAVSREGLSTSRVAGRRLAAACIDYGLLLSIDMAVVYFAVRIAGLSMSEWRLIPPVPMGIFLGLMAFAYFTAFTAVGGQTIGKMALSIRVVHADNHALTIFTACRRTCAGILTMMTLGLAYVPGLLGEDRRALHDRLAHTRVVALPAE